MSVIKFIVSFLALIFISTIYGCSTAQPNFYNGKYYMAGDANCKYIRQIEENRVMCMNAKKVDVGYRDAMTDQQLLMYMNQKQVNATLMAPQLAPKQQSVKPTKCYPDPFGGSMTCY